MSPRCFQQLPFSTFSLTFFCFDKGFCPSTTAAWEVSLAGWWPQPSQHGLLLLLTRDKLAFKTQKILCGWTRVSPMAALFIPASQGWKVPAPACVLSWGSAGQGWGGGWRRAGVWGWRSSHKNWTKPGLFNMHTPARGGTGSAVLLLFSALSGPFGFAGVGFSVLLLVQQPLGSCFLMQVWEPVPFT